MPVVGRSGMPEMDTLRLALQKKCDQYMKLQIAHQNRKEHLAMVEAALETANKKLKENLLAPQRKIKVNICVLCVN